LITFFAKDTPVENQIIKKYTFALALGLIATEKQHHKFNEHDALWSMKHASHATFFQIGILTYNGAQLAQYKNIVITLARLTSQQV